MDVLDIYETPFLYERLSICFQALSDHEIRNSV